MVGNPIVAHRFCIKKKMNSHFLQSSYITNYIFIRSIQFVHCRSPWSEIKMILHYYDKKKTNELGLSLSDDESVTFFNSYSIFLIFYRLIDADVKEKF